MLWIGICEAVSVAVVGGVVGGCLMAIANKANNKWNVERLEKYWREENWQLRSGLELASHKINELTEKLSTISVNKPVSNGKNHSHNKGYKPKRHFDQRG